jgi:hypothetical protein
MTAVDASSAVLVAGPSATRVAEDLGVMDVSDGGRRPSLDGFRGVVGEGGRIGTTGTRGTDGLDILLCCVGVRTTGATEDGVVG